MKAVVLEDYAIQQGDLDWSGVKALVPDITRYGRTAQEEVVPRIGDAEIVFLNKCRIDEAVLAQCPKLRWVGIIATGTDNLDLKACRRHGVPVANVPGYSTYSVAQMTFSLLLAICQCADRYHRLVQDGQWRTEEPAAYGLLPQVELLGKTFGIYGYGSIGRQTARIAKAFGFSGTVPVCGQTYSRKWDAMVANVLSGIAQSCMKFATDLRLLQSFKEMEEPFEAGQIGSSAMPYKRNPMRCERICALARYVMADCLNPALTAGAQGFERTLDDSANKRIAMAEAFLAVDGILDIMLNVCDGLVVYPKVIRARVMAELPFMATENILMDAVKRGGDRQELHEKLRVYSQRAARAVKEEGAENPLLEYICADGAFGTSRQELEALLDPARFTGRAAGQTQAFVQGTIRPLLQSHSALLGARATLLV